VAGAALLFYGAITSAGAAGWHLFCSGVMGRQTFFTHMGQHHGRYRNRIGIIHVNQANANTSFVCVMRFDRYELFDAAGVGDLRVAVLVRRSRPYAALGLVQCLRKRHKP